VERHAGLVVRVRRLRQREAERERALRVEAGVDVSQQREAPDQQPRPGEQHHRERDLADHERRAQADARPAQDAAAALAQRLRRRAPAHLERGQRAEEQAGRERDERRERQHAAVDPDLGQARHALRLERQQRVDQAPGEERAERAAYQREQQALGEQLAHDAAAARPERRAQRELALARADAREQQVRDVHARHEQHQPDRAEQHEQRLAGVADERLAEAGRRPADALVLARVLLGEAGGDRGHLLARCGDRRAGRETGHDVQVPGAAAVGAEELVVRERPPDLGAFGVAEARRGDADHGAGLAVDLHVLADDGGIAAEALLPQRVAEHDHVRAARLVLARHEPAAERRPHAQHIEEGRAHRGALQANRVAVAGERHPGRVERRESLQRLRLLLDVEEVLGRQPRDRTCPSRAPRPGPGGRPPGTAAAATAPRSRR
jgi:hypothetical protein